MSVPQQQVAGVAGGDSLEGVHSKLVGIVGGVLRTDIGSEDRRNTWRITWFIEKSLLLENSIGCGFTSTSTWCLESNRKLPQAE